LRVTSSFASEPNQADLTKQQLKSLTANTSTPEDHRKWPSTHEQEVQRETAKAQKAEQDLRAEEANPARRSTKQPNGRLDYFKYEVTHHQKAAEKAQALMALHREKRALQRPLLLCAAQSGRPRKTVAPGRAVLEA